MASDESLIVLKPAIPLKSKKKMPLSPSEGMLRLEEPKKLTTKEMVRKALADLKTGSRKGVSLKAIKKYIHEEFSVDVERNNYIIKKIIKSAVENGSIIQTKGIGASGSFRLAPMKDKAKKKKQIKKKTENTKAQEKEKADKNPEKKEKISKNTKETKELKTEKKKMSEPVEKSKKSTKDVAEGTKNRKPTKEKSSENPKKGLKKMGSLKTPAKKRAAMMKRKSIGSVRKPPKMKPTKK